MVREEATSILLAGVGGQGIIRASDILCDACMRAGWDVKKSEVHGMAQRGGSVTSHVRFGKKVFSPVAGKGEVTLMVSFELLESLRYFDYLYHDCKVFLNNYRLSPPAVNLGTMTYPEGIDQLLSEQLPYVRVINARSIAQELGNIRAENMVLIGVLAAHLPVSIDVWHEVLPSYFSSSLRDVNVRAFDRGLQLAQSIDK